MSSRKRTYAVAVCLTFAAAACTDGTGPVGSSSVLDAAFNVVPAEFSNVESSFQGGTTDGFVGGFAADMRGPRGGPGGGPRGGPERGGHPGPGGNGRGPGLGGLMGGGMWHGLDAFGGGLRPGNLEGCTLGADGRVTCPDVVRGGLTFTKSFAFTTAAGVAQAAPDELTNTINTKKSVSGTVELRNDGTSIVNHRSDRTVTGLASPSTQVTINGTAQGTEETDFTNRDGVAVAIDHAASDAWTNVVVPKPTDGPTYPISGTVERNMSVTVSENGAVTRSVVRRELITYNGTATATLIITVNGVTKTCSLPLPHGRPTCE